VRLHLCVQLIWIDVGIRHSLAVARGHGWRLVGAEFVVVGWGLSVVIHAHDERLPRG
jgi:hypothetical protein